MRSANATAVGLHKSGANVWLAINETKMQLAPQVKMTRRKITFLLRFVRQFPLKKQSFLQQMTNEHATYVGVARQFAPSLSDICWQCHGNGDLFHEDGFQSNWIPNSIGYVYKPSDKAWSRFVCKPVNRPGWDSAGYSIKAFQQSINVRQNMQVYSKQL